MFEYVLASNVLHHEALMDISKNFVRLILQQLVMFPSIIIFIDGEKCDCQNFLSNHTQTHTHTHKAYIRRAPANDKHCLATLHYVIHAKLRAH